MTLTTLQLSKHQGVSYRTKGSGEPLVLIHGVGMQSAAWKPQIGHFSESYRVIALDMPGHGGSDPLPEGSELPDFVAWGISVLEGLGLGAVNLVGHSMGALIAGGVATTRPDLVQRVALLNSVYQRDKAAKAAVVGRAAEIAAGKIDVQTPLDRWFDDHQQEERAQVAGWLKDVDPSGYAAAYAAFANGDTTYADALHAITCPLLAMTGDGDPNSTPAMSRDLAALMPSGQAAIINGHRHMINLTATEEVNAHLQIWLARPITKQGDLRPMTQGS